MKPIYRFLLLILATSALLAPATFAQNEPYRDANLPVEERVEDLLNRMTLDEKIGQMTLVEKNSITDESVTKFYIGAVLSGGGGYPNPNTPEAWAEMVESYQEGALATRLGIPLIYGIDAVHGHNNVYGATIFPHQVGLGATGNPELVQQIGAITAIEMIATGIYWNYAPVIAVPQDIRWGRAYEGYGENTDLVTELGTAFLLGLQGTLGDPLSVLATPKHYIGDGATTWGTSDKGTNHIDRGDARIDEETLRTRFLPPYIAAIENGAMNIMVSYSSWNGVSMHAHDYLVNDVLKGELGFEGFVVSDWAGIDLVSEDYYEAVVRSINSGVDMNMVPQKYPEYIDIMKRAVENGDISMERIDDAVRRILRTKIMLGLFERPFSNPDLIDQIGSAEHREVARQAVSESLVLLRNDNQALPISDDTNVIFVAGQGADDIGMQSGGWTIEHQGRIGDITIGTSILEGLEARASEDTEIFYSAPGLFNRVTDENDNPVQADVGIAVIGEFPYAEWTGDNNTLAISESDIAMIERMRERSDKLVVILLSGRPMIVTEQVLMADAFVAAWLPGSEGQGVADVLLGDVPFTGHLPFTWPRQIEQIPFDFNNLATEGCDAPLFPYGYGLSYEDTASAWVSLAMDCANLSMTEADTVPFEAVEYNPDGEWILVWSDEFDAEANAPINDAYWTCEVGGHGWGNAQLEHNTDRIENVYHNGDGYLAITAREEDYMGNAYTSGRCNTNDKVEFMYGKVEARIDLPEGQGIWPAFWMLGADFPADWLTSDGYWPSVGEIDIMEYVGKEPRSTHGTIHGPGYSGGSGLGVRYLHEGAAAEGFHVFGIEWEPDVIRFYMDGELYFTASPDSLYKADWVFNDEFFMLINLAVGGNWPGNPDDTTELPQSMLIDWVRVYQRQ